VSPPAPSGRPGTPVATPGLEDEADDEFDERMSFEEDDDF
jgi:hypothetical protein